MEGFPKARRVRVIRYSLARPLTLPNIVAGRLTLSVSTIITEHQEVLSILASSGYPSLDISVHFLTPPIDDVTSPAA